MPYRFKVADSDAEFAQIARLNHRVFSEELLQHLPETTGLLTDKFHPKNRYVIALEEDRLIGMIAAHDEPPYSVAARLADPTVLDRLGRVVEVRLLAVDPAHRSGTVMSGLMLGIYELARGHDAIAISGIVEQAQLYRALGFQDLGPAVQTGDAWFIPMFIRVDDLARRRDRWSRRLSTASAASLFA